MTVRKDVSTSLGTMGTGREKKQSIAKAITGIVFFTPDTAVAATEGLTCLNTPDINTGSKKVIDKDWWNSKTKTQNGFPFPVIKDYSDVSTPAKEYKYPSGYRKFVGDSIKSFEFKFDLPLDTHRQMQTFDGADLSFVLIEADGKVRFWNDGGTFRPFQSAMIHPVMSTEVAADGGAPAFSGLMVDFLDYRQWDQFGDEFYPDWSPMGLEPLVPTTLVAAQVGTTKVITVTVGSDGGYDRVTGAQITVPIRGLTKDHFLVKNAGGVDQVLVSSVETAKGVYTITLPVNTVSGAITVTLQTIANDEIGDLLLDPVGAAAVTLTIA